MARHVIHDARPQLACPAPWFRVFQCRRCCVFPHLCVCAGRRSPISSGACVEHLAGATHGRPGRQHTHSCGDIRGATDFGEVGFSEGRFDWYWLANDDRHRRRGRPDRLADTYTNTSLSLVSTPYTLLGAGPPHPGARCHPGVARVVAPVLCLRLGLSRTAPDHVPDTCPAAAVALAAIWWRGKADVSPGLVATAMCAARQWPAGDPLHRSMSCCGGPQGSAKP